MRLINIETQKLEEFFDDTTPEYAILSHTWGHDSEEVSYRDFQKGRINKASAGWMKIQGCCQKAKEYQLKYVWIDTCCIDQTNSVELGEAVNSMFRWYRRAALCYIYLVDVPDGDIVEYPHSRFQTSRWFRRGWTLQELLAPKHLRFYNSEWNYLGTKEGLSAVIETITGISRRFLLGISKLGSASVAQRMSWAANRQTKRKEDLAYCLLGIFDISMSMIYGEGGEKAFMRLQELIMKTTKDDSILAWHCDSNEPFMNMGLAESTPRRILASSPSNFENCGRIVMRNHSTTSRQSLELSGGSLRISLPIIESLDGRRVGLLNCGPANDTRLAVGIVLEQINSTSTSDLEYARVAADRLVLWPSPSGIWPQPIQISDIISTMEAVDRQYWLFDSRFTALRLDLLDVTPRAWWQEDKAMVITTATAFEKRRHRFLARFRHNNSTSADFIVVVEFWRLGDEFQVEYRVMICDRDTPLAVEDGKLNYLMRNSHGKSSARNGIVNMQVTLDHIEGDPPLFIFSVKGLDRPPPLEPTINMTTELQIFDSVLEFAKLLEETTRISKRKVELKRKTTAPDVEMARHLGDTLKTLRQKRTARPQQWPQARKQTNKFYNTNTDNSVYDLNRGSEHAALQWAAENGHAELAELILAHKVADLAAAYRNGTTATALAIIKAYVKYLEPRLAKSKIKHDSKTAQQMQQAYPHALANGQTDLARPSFSEYEATYRSTTKNDDV